VFASKDQIIYKPPNLIARINSGLGGQQMKTKEADVSLTHRLSFAGLTT
jgi:hypothetical protein